MLHTTDEEIDQVLHTTFLLVGAPVLMHKVTWDWNRRMSATLGRAIYDDNHLQFSTKLWAEVTPDRRRETVIHEGCHLAANELFDHREHGEPWKRLMQICSVEPRECHDIALNYRQAFCGCPQGVRISKIRYNRIVTNEAGYSCGRCGQSVRTT